MKNYTICIESYYSNNSDLKEYDNYTCVAECYQEALEYAQLCVSNWNKQSKGVIYHIYDITPHN